MSLEICIMAPDRIVLDTKVEEIILPTNTGQIGVLPNHSTLLTGLEIGIMLVREGNQWVAVGLMGGFALINENKVNILVNYALSAADVKKSEAEATFNAARIALDNAETKKEKIERSIAYRRARVCFQLSKEEATLAAMKKN